MGAPGYALWTLALAAALWWPIAHLVWVLSVRRLERRLGAALAGRAPDDADGIAAALDAAAGEIETQGDLWADPDYRKQLIRSLGAEVAATAFARATGRS